MTCPAHQIAAARGMLREEDVDLIRTLVDLLPLDRDVLVCDLGAGVGTSALAVFAARDTRIEVVTIDQSRDALLTVEQELAAWGITPTARWSGLQSVSWEVGASWDKGPVDLLLLDTSHEYEDTCREFDAWLPHLRAGSLIWAHDYLGEYPGCAQAINELIDAKRAAQIAIRGLGWAGVKV